MSKGNLRRLEEMEEYFRSTTAKSLHNIPPKNALPTATSIPRSASNQVNIPPNPLAASAEKPVPAQAPAPEAKTLLDPITDFLGRYLQCTEHQRNLLALWVLHTHCFSAAQFTPYLSIYSPEKQSGKTLCLQLLSLLCPNPALSSGVTAATLSRRTDSADRPTFLLDEAQVTLGSRSRSKNPTLRGLLVSGFQRGIGYSDRKGERNLFSPKAFAGIGPLPQPIADRSLPIILEPLKPLQRFHPGRAQEEAKPLLQQLQNWAKEHLPTLQAAKAYSEDKFPPNLSPRRQDMIEPLLHLADSLAGVWPQRARQCITGILEDQLAKENQQGLQLLNDIREAFVHYGRPDRLSTTALLAFLHTLPDRPWNQEAPITAQTLSALLAPFGIRSRCQRIKASPQFSSPHRGYTAQDFVPKWARLLPQESKFNNDTSVRYNRYPGTKEEAQAWCDEAERKELVAADLNQQEAERKQLITAQRLQKARQKAQARASGNPSIHAGCSKVATSPQNPPTGQSEDMTEEQKALWAQVRKMQNSLPACAEREMVRVAPPFLKR